jgi:hypothetical protein
MRVFLYGFVAIAALLGSIEANAEIFRCEDPEGGIVYQETPCPDPNTEAAEVGAEAEDDAADVDMSAAPGNPRRLERGESLEEEVASIEEENRRRREIEACKRQYRDAIDGIDLEIRNSYSPEQKEYYLKRLKMLTDQMAAC